MGQPFNFGNEGWIAALGATMGAIALKVVERLLNRRRESFDEQVSLTKSDRDHIADLWVRIEGLQQERERLYERLRDAERQRGQLEAQVDQLRLLIRERQPPP